MTLEQDLEIGEFYRNRTSSSIYIIIYIDDINLTYTINEIHKKATISISAFKEGVKKGSLARLGKMSENELAKYLLQR